MQDKDTLTAADINAHNKHIQETVETPPQPSFPLNFPLPRIVFESKSWRL